MGNHYHLLVTMRPEDEVSDQREHRDIHFLDFIHAELVDRLPPVHRIFAGCAAQLIGDISSGRCDHVPYSVRQADFANGGLFWGSCRLS
jgi:hypothetical protein